MLQAQTIEQAKVVIGVSAYNEESSIARTIIRMRGIADEIILCDDGSSDSTSEIAEALNCKVLSNAHKVGPIEAMRALFLAALKSDADVLVVLPTNTEFERSDISKLADSVLKAECDIAVGSRVRIELPKSDSELSGEILTAAGMPLRDAGSPFRAYGKQALSKLVSYLRDDDSDVLTYAMKLGLNISEQQLSTLTEHSQNSDAPAQKKGRKQKAHSIGGKRDPLAKLFSVRPPAILYEGASLATLASAVAVAGYTAYEYAKWGAALLGNFLYFGIEFSAVLFVLSAIFFVATALDLPRKSSTRA